MAKVQKKYKTVPVFQRLRPANSPAGPRRLRGPVPHGARSNKKSRFYQPDVSNIINSISEQTAAKKKIGGFLGRSAKRIIIFIYNNKTACNFFRRKNTLKNFTKSLYFSILSFTFAKPLRQCPSLPRRAAPFFSEGVPVFRRNTRQTTFRTGQTGEIAAHDTRCPPVGSIYFRRSVAENVSPVDLYKNKKL